MSKRSCPFSEDISRQLKKHVDDLEADAEAKAKIHEQTLMKLKEGAKRSTDPPTTGSETDVQPALETDVQPGIETDIQPGIETGIQPGIETGIQPGIETDAQLDLNETSNQRTLRHYFSTFPQSSSTDDFDMSHQEMETEAPDNTTIPFLKNEPCQKSILHYFSPQGTSSQNENGVEKKKINSSSDGCSFCDAKLIKSEFSEYCPDCKIRFCVACGSAKRDPDNTGVECRCAASRQKASGEGENSGEKVAFVNTGECYLCDNALIPSEYTQFCPNCTMYFCKVCGEASFDEDNVCDLHVPKQD